ncbi:hypothetical protein HDU91_004770 [Kappamyces sp. JEL0680]|nr:hypothetical protein HDU91_004770 [Kappamyces sp. JEL0680]
MDQPWKIAIFSISVSTFVFDAVILFVCWRANYAPFKARQLDLLFYGIISSFFWQIGALQVQGILGYESILQYCTLYASWLQVFLGVNTYLALLTFRMYRLYMVAAIGSQAAGWRFWLPILAPLIYVFILGLVPYFTRVFTILPEFNSATGKVECFYLNKMYLAIMFTPLILQLAFMIYLTFQLSGIKKAFNEFMEMRIALILCTFFIALYMILAIAFSASTWRTIAICIINLIGNNTVIWSILFRPLCGYILNKETYLSDFRKSMKEEPTMSSHTKSKRKQSVRGHSQRGNSDVQAPGDRKRGPSLSVAMNPASTPGAGSIKSDVQEESTPSEQS